MAYLLVGLVIVTTVSQSLILKQYQLKTRENTNLFLYTSLVSVFAMLFFLLSSGGALSFRKELLPYSLAYGMVYCMSLFGGTNSVCRGSLSISMLILQCSLIIPALFGIVFFKERISSFGYVGIILLFVSLFLVNTKNEQMKISRSWVFWTIIGFIGNGMCSPVQKMQQLRFEGLYKNEFMVLASLFVTVVAFIAGIYKNKKVKQDFVSCVCYAPVHGIVNGLDSLLVMILIGILPTAILFPLVSAGGMVVTFIVSLLVYRERLSKKQLLGYLCGTVSIILLNL